MSVKIPPVYMVPRKESTPAPVVSRIQIPVPPAPATPVKSTTEREQEQVAQEAKVRETLHVPERTQPNPQALTVASLKMLGAPTKPERIEYVDDMLDAKREKAIEDALKPDTGRRKTDIVLDPFQRKALNTVKNEQFCCIVGPAGSGKTTVLHAALDVLMDSAWFEDKYSGGGDYNINLAAFTGRATQQMKLNLDTNMHRFCDTIHGTLKYKPVYETRIDKDTGDFREVRVFRPQHNKDNKLPSRVLVLDESGMIPVRLWNELMAARQEDCRILLLGDIQQLPPPIGKSVLGFAMNEWPVAALEKIHRTDENAIISTAHDILNGRRPRTHHGVVLMKTIDHSGETAARQVCAGVADMFKKGEFDPAQDAIIVAYNDGVLGQNTLNNYLVHTFNPPRYEDGLPVNPRYIIKLNRETKGFAEGDKVMLTQNIREQNLTNGQWGFVQRIWQNPAYAGNALEDLDLSKIDFASVEFAQTTGEAEQLTENERQASHCMEVLFQAAHGPETVIFQRVGEFASIQLAYVCTCHKMQGSEARKVIVVAHSAQVKLLTREWLYTAATRAQSQLLILYNDRGLNKALRKQVIVGDTIQEKAASFAKLMTADALRETDPKNIPSIPPPRPYFTEEDEYADEDLYEEEDVNYQSSFPMDDEEREANVNMWNRVRENL